MKKVAVTFEKVMDCPFYMLGECPLEGGCEAKEDAPPPDNCPCEDA
jgi:hypothetical protein